MAETVFRRATDPDPAALAGPMPSSDTLYTMAEAIMERLKLAALGQGVALPTRQFIYTGEIPGDCEQAAVTFSGWTPMPAWETSTKCTFRWFGNISVAITRCSSAVPSKKGAIPTAAQMSEAALTASRDADVLMELVNLISELGAELQIQTSAPSGGLQSVEINMQVPLLGGLD